MTSWRERDRFLYLDPKGNKGRGSWAQIETLGTEISDHLEEKCYSDMARKF